MGVAFIVDKAGEARLRLFGYVKKRCTNVSVKCERLAIVGIRKVRDKPKKS